MTSKGKEVHATRVKYSGADEAPKGREKPPTVAYLGKLVSMTGFAYQGGESHIFCPVL